MILIVRFNVSVKPSTIGSCYAILALMSTDPCNGDGSGEPGHV